MTATSALQTSCEEHRRERSSRELTGRTKPPATFSRAPVTSGSGSCSTVAFVALVTLRKQFKSSAKSVGMKLPALQHKSPRVGLQGVSLRLSLENPGGYRKGWSLLAASCASDPPTPQHTSRSNYTDYTSIHPITIPAM